MPSALDTATELLGKVGKPAYVEFSTIAKHLPRRSEQEGRYVAIDVDIVTVRQIGAADSVIYEVEKWLACNTVEVRANRLPREHAVHYERMYQLWKQGQELPVEGTPIKGWAVISPSQAEAIVRAGIRTVEDLAQMNGEAMQRVGMGAVMLKNKAQAWVAQAKDKGPLTMEMAELKKQNDLLRMSVEKLTEQNAELAKQRSHAVERTVLQEEPNAQIGLTDILDQPPPPSKGQKRKEG